MKKRFFIRYADAEEVFIDRIFSLTDEDLIIKVPKSDGTVIFEPIISISGFDKDDVANFNKACLSRRNELLVEIPAKEVSLINPELLVKCTEISNNIYYEEGSVFNERTIKLIDFGAYSLMSKNKVPSSKINVVVMLPSNIEDGKMYVTEKSSVIALGEAANSRRETLAKTALGSDLYIQTADSEIIDDYRTWVTEVQEEKRNVYTVMSKDYFVFKPLSKKEREQLSIPELKALDFLLKNAMIAFTTRNPHKILYDEAPEVAEESWLIRRENLEVFIEQGISALPFKERFEVFRQTNQGIKTVSLEDALDIPRTVIKDSQENSITVPDTKKTKLLYEYNPNIAVPDSLHASPIKVYKSVDLTENGRLIWVKTNIIVPVKMDEIYNDELLKKGNRCFIEVSPQDEKKICRELSTSGLLHEFEVYDCQSNDQKDITYYVASPYVPEVDPYFNKAN